MASEKDSRNEPPRCAVETIRPALVGPSKTVSHSSSPKSAFPVMDSAYPARSPPKQKRDCRAGGTGRTGGLVPFLLEPARLRRLAARLGDRDADPPAGLRRHRHRLGRPGMGLAGGGSRAGLLARALSGSPLLLLGLESTGTGPAGSLAKVRQIPLDQTWIDSSHFRLPTRWPSRARRPVCAYRAPILRLRPHREACTSGGRAFKGRLHSCLCL